MRFDESHRAALSAASAATWEDPGIRARRTKAITDACNDPLLLALRRVEKTDDEIREANRLKQQRYREAHPEKVREWERRSAERKRAL